MARVSVVVGPAFNVKCDGQLLERNYFPLFVDLACSPVNRTESCTHLGACHWIKLILHKVEYKCKISTFFFANVKHVYKHNPKVSHFCIALVKNVTRQRQLTRS